jgi:hypothetical protein
MPSRYGDGEGPCEQRSDSHTQLLGPPGLERWHDGNRRAESSGDPLATGGSKDLFAKHISEQEAARGSDEAIVSNDAAGHYNPLPSQGPLDRGVAASESILHARMGHRSRERRRGVRISRRTKVAPDARFEAVLGKTRRTEF